MRIVLRAHEKKDILQCKFEKNLADVTKEIFSIKNSCIAIYKACEKYEKDLVSAGDDEDLVDDATADFIDTVQDARDGLGAEILKEYTLNQKSVIPVISKNLYRRFDKVISTEKNLYNGTAEKDENGNTIYLSSEYDKLIAVVRGVFDSTTYTVNNGYLRDLYTLSYEFAGFMIYLLKYEFGVEALFYDLFSNSEGDLSKNVTSVDQLVLNDTAKDENFALEMDNFLTVLPEFSQANVVETVARLYLESLVFIPSIPIFDTPEMSIIEDEFQKIMGPFASEIDEDLLTKEEVVAILQGTISPVELANKHAAQLKDMSCF